MATIGSVDIRTLTINMFDDGSENMLKAYDLGGATVDADIETALEDLDDVTNGAFGSTYLTDKYSISGLTAVAGTAPHKYLAMAGFMTFRMVHPLNPAKYVTKQVLVPSITASLFDDDTHNLVFGDPAAVTPTASDKLARLRDFFIDNLAYTAVDGSVTVGGWTLVDSGLYALGSDINGV